MFNMSNVYHFDDKILHIDSLQLKRTNDILESREEAVEALLNYCGDETMDGMPLLARYWADTGHTEIKHVRGYIHYLHDGDEQGISIDDICDVTYDDLIDVLESAMTYTDEALSAQTEDCRLKAWTDATNDPEFADPTGNDWLFEPFATKSGVYNAVNILNGEVPTGTTPVMDINGDANIYVASYDREGNPFGSRVNTDGVLVVRYRNEDPVQSGGTAIEKYFIIDPHKHDSQIKGLKKSLKRIGNKVVIKQAIKLRSQDGMLYYFQGRGIPFQMPIILPGDTVRIHFPYWLCPYPEANDMQIAFKRARTAWTNDPDISVYDLYNSGDLVCTWTSAQTPGDDAILAITNNSQFTTPRFSITMTIDPSSHAPIGISEDNIKYILIKVGAIAALNGQGSSQFQQDFYYNMLFEPSSGSDDEGYENMNKPITVDTTSPGFRVENGIIKCYRASDFKKFLNKRVDIFKDEHYDTGNTFVENIKYVKDGTVFHYSERNMNLGTSPVFVRQTREFFSLLTEVRYDTQGEPKGMFLRRKDGILEFVSPILKRRRWRYHQRPETGQPFICYVQANYNGLYMPETFDNYLSFDIVKGVSDENFQVTKIGLSFRGADGEMHDIDVKFSPNGLIPGNNGTLPASGGTTTVIFNASDELNSFVNTPYYGGSFQVRYVSVRVNTDNERYMVAGDAGARTYLSRTRWKPVNKFEGHGTWTLHHKFEYSKFHRCRFIEKFKGVPSEFPELFYSR